ncbi:MULTISPECIES: efflux RND transporter permease subunit [Bacillaceae]|uniref:Efflux RND transporter permease subunit n=1 Tax=Evansella alkalicola TaxID=745819 RepID=A0ABS6JWX3_9BACI|nr:MULTISPECIES: efflux RND transporter permease subunit [Bacillaceae]MBU9722581.1 efflux RND transporter permease subunit [Bacillus alkalicola]
MNLLKFIVRRKVLVGLMAVLVVLTGSYAMMKLDKELMPSIDFDGGYVEISAGDLSATEVERTITSLLERQLQTIDGVDRIQSTSSIGRSSIHMTFESGLGEELIKEVESVVNSTTSDIANINYMETGRYGTNQSYEFFMDLADGHMEELTEFAETVLQPRLEALPEVRDVFLGGVVENEISIAFHRDKLTDKGLDITQVIGLIQENNREATLGELSGETDSPLLRWTTGLESLDSVKNMTIPTPEGFIQLDEIATVSLEPLASTSHVWKNGSKDFIFVQIGRVSDVTQIDMAEAIRAELHAIEEEGLVKDFTMNEIVAQADYVQEAIDGVSSNILIGAILALVILLLFLRNVRATFIIGTAIPTSVLLTFLAMWLFDYSFNMLTLIALGLGIGMMVDAAIVILESIYRKKEEGLVNFEAVIEGVKEVATPVFASMLTTIVVFVPIGLVGGEMGEFVLILSAVVAITLISSVVIAFTLIPTLAEKFLKLKQPRDHAKNNAGDYTRKEGMILRSYSRLVAWIVRKKRWSIAIIAIFFSIFVGSLFLVSKVPMTIMPDVLNRYAEVGIDVDNGMTVEEKDALIHDIHASLSDIEDVETNYILDNGGLLYAIINMTKDDDITQDQKSVNEEIMRSLRDLEEEHPVNAVFNAMDGGGGYPVQVNVKGDDFDELQTITANLMEKLNDVDGMVGLTNSIERTSIEELVQMKEDEIEDAGLTVMQIRQVIEEAFIEMPVAEMNVEGSTVPLIVKWAETMDLKEQLLDLTVSTIDGERKLSDFITLTSTNTPNEIRRVDGERFASISADIEDRDLGSVNRDIQNIIDDFTVPTGYSVAVAGDLEQQQELIMEMLLVFAIALFLVYFVMAVQFNHFLHPIIVMSVIPMTLVGAIAGLFITQRELSIMSAMGLVMLVGIVLNNAILLIDRTNKLRLEGYGVEDALIIAGKNRIRPIFMTTLTTAGGMLPLAIASGASGNYQAPMATVIISGLLFATLITLVLIPAVYRLFNATGKGISKVFRFKKQEETNKESRAAS